MADQTSATKRKESDHAKLAAAAANEGLVAAGKDGEPKTKKRKLEKDPSTSNKKIVASHLQFWTNRHAELHGLPPKDDEECSAEPGTSSTKKQVEQRRIHHRARALQIWIENVVFSVHGNSKPKQR